MASGPMVYLDGTVVAAAAAHLAVDDAGFERGDGVFETIRLEAGVPLDLALHLDRLQYAVGHVGIELPEDRDELRAAVAAVAATAPRPVARLRITVSRGRPGAAPTRIVAATETQDLGPERYHAGVPAALVRGIRIDTSSPLSGIKSTSYQLYGMALRRARQAGAWEALLLNEHGRLAEGSRSNVFVEIERRLLTPPLDEGCLPGTIRELAIRAGMAHESQVAARDLAHVDAMLLSNSLVGLVPVSRLDARDLVVERRHRRLRFELNAVRERGI